MKATRKAANGQTAKNRLAAGSIVDYAHMVAASKQRSLKLAQRAKIVLPT